MSLLLDKLVTHVFLCIIAMSVAILIALPLGILLAKTTRRNFILSIASISQTIPSLAAMAMLIPLVGIGVLPTLIILAFYATYPILKNTVVGLLSVPKETLEAADSLGFTFWQKLSLIEVPLAMPNIIAGVRIATSMTIGIATIAAFIGAGGLGDFITQGLALNNMKLLALGAIPAALLALVADLGISLLEAKVSALKRGKFTTWRIFAIVVAALSTCVVVAIHETRFAIQKPIVIASKNFTESYILCEIMAQLIEEKTNLTVERKINLGTTDTVHQAMLKGDVDIYPEYTGTAYMTVLHKDAQVNSTEIFNEVAREYRRQFDFVWLSPFGFSNAQTLATTKPIAKKYGLRTLSDLVPIAPLFTIAAPAEFIERIDALPKLRETYGLSFKSIKQVDPNLMYTAIANNQVDLIVAFSTDGKLQQWDLMVLDDDKSFAPPYEAAPVVRGAVLRAYPQIAEVLSLLKNQIDEKTMRELNSSVDIKGLTPRAAAQKFIDELLNNAQRTRVAK